MQRANPIFILFVSVLMMAGGCSHSADKEITLTPETKIDQGYVIDREKLQQGGRIYIEPFLPGADVFATEQMQQMSLKAVRGIADVFHEEDAPFEIVTDRTAETPDLVMKGYITQFTVPGKMKRWVLFKRGVTLKITGRIFDADTGENIIYFSEKIESNIGDKAHYLDLAYRLGRQIGGFIIQYVE